MSVVAQADGLMDKANTMVGAATFVLPPVVVIYMEFKASTGKASELDKAGQEWRKAAQQLGELRADLQQSVSSITPQDWTGLDRPPYEAKVAEFCSQLEALETFCDAAGTTLTGLSYALLSYAVFAQAMAVVVDGLAVAAVAAAASVLGSVTLPAIEGVAATCATISSVSTGILATTGEMAAMAFAGGALMNAAVESNRGNKEAMGDFVTAQQTGSAEALATLGQNGANLALDYFNRQSDAMDRQGRTPEEREKAEQEAAARGETIKDPKPGGGIGLKEVDLDAYRGFDRTWDVGASAHVEAGGTEHDIGARGQYGDKGLQGLQGEYSGTYGNGLSAEAKGGFTTNEHGQRVYSGSASAGYTDETTGLGGKIGTEGTYNSGDGTYSLKGQGSAQYESASGVSAEAKGGFEMTDHSKPVYTGGASAGYTNEASGLGGSVGTEGTYDSGDGSYSVKSEGTAQYNGQDVYQESHEYSQDGAGQGEWKHKTTTPLGESETPPWDLV